MIEHIFSNTVICQDMEQARAIAYDRSFGLRCVTLDGDFVDPSGAITGGSRRGVQGSRSAATGEEVSVFAAASAYVSAALAERGIDTHAQLIDPASTVPPAASLRSLQGLQDEVMSKAYLVELEAKKVASHVAQLSRDSQLRVLLSDQKQAATETKAVLEAGARAVIAVQVYTALHGYLENLAGPAGAPRRSIAEVQAELAKAEDALGRVRHELEDYQQKLGDLDAMKLQLQVVAERLDEARQSVPSARERAEELRKQVEEAEKVASGCSSNEHEALLALQAFHDANTSLAAELKQAEEDAARAAEVVTKTEQALSRLQTRVAEARSNLRERAESASEILEAMGADPRRHRTQSTELTELYGPLGLGDRPRLDTIAVSLLDLVGKLPLNLEAGDEPGLERLYSGIRKLRKRDSRENRSDLSGAMEDVSNGAALDRAAYTVLEALLGAGEIQEVCSRAGVRLPQAKAEEHLDGAVPAGPGEGAGQQPASLGSQDMRTTLLSAFNLLITLPQQEFQSLFGAVKRTTQALRLSAGTSEQIPTQYQDLRKSSEQLIAMRDRLLRDKEKILNVIHRIDVKKGESLLNVYHVVAGHMRDIFGILLPGASCDLRMVNPNDIGEGLTFAVRIGGSESGLSGLSGGQKSLLALALTLALLLYKPCPLYILDEIDSALDLSHTQNVGRLIKTKFPYSQFLVVSLKEGMFNNAAVLFRTKYVSGVSRVERYGKETKR